MKNAIGELFGKECVVTVTNNPHISDGVFNLPVDAKGVADGTSVSNIVISVPVGVLDSNRCMRGAKLRLTLIADGSGSYSIVPDEKMEYLSN